MRNNLLLLIFIPFFSFSQKTYVPDDIFEVHLEANGMGDGIILNDSVLTSNINTVTYLGLYNKNIADLTGVEDFTALTILYCHNNQLTSIDVSQNLALIEFRCSDNQLTSLDISANTVLDDLNCDDNQLTSLDLSNNTSLTILSFYDNQLTSIDLSTNINLENLTCQYNQLTSLDLSNNLALTFLESANNQLTSLDLRNHSLLNLYLYTPNPNLLCIDVDNPALASIVFSNSNIGQASFSTNCLSALGCMDSLALNYDSLANIDDGTCVYSSALSLQGVLDLYAGTLNYSGSDGKAVHLVALADIPDLSVYSLDVISNGNGPPDPIEYVLSGSALAGEDILIYKVGSGADSPNFFSDYFGSCYSEFEITTASGSSFPNGNGDDPVALFMHNQMVDSLTYNGNPILSGSFTGDPYNDSWAYRLSDGTWQFGGKDCDQNDGTYSVYTSGCPYPICLSPANLGCTDSIAVNYDSTAIFNDGSCLYNCSLYTLNMYDSFGDGWNGDSLVMTSSNGTNYITATIPSGVFATTSICVPFDCYSITCGGGQFPGEVSWDILDSSGTVILSGGAPYSDSICLPVITGCTDTFANNYDSLVTVDDGSCIYGCIENDTIFSFEYGTGTIWKMDPNNDIDWTNVSIATPSFGTGPSSAFDGSFYMYTEASAGGYPNKEAIMYVECIDPTQWSSLGIAFAYHMYGSDMGTLSVDISTDSGTTWIQEWSLSGDQGDQWNEAYVNLSAYTSNISVRFKGVTGSSYKSDMAVDLVRFNNFFGCTDPLATNYDSFASFDDGSCFYCSYGCTDSLSLNYDSLAICDDGSCIYCYNDTTFTNITSCDSYFWNGTIYTASGSYYSISGTTTQGCDSISNLNLTIDSSSINIYSCVPYTWNGQTYDSTGIYTYTPLSSVGCSTSTLYLTINNNNVNLGDDIYACNGEYITIGDTLLDSSNTFNWTSLNNLLFWEDVGDTTFTSNPIENLVFKLDNNDVPYIAFTERPTFTESIISVMKFDGTNWVYVGNDINDGQSKVPDIIFDANNTLYVSFEDIKHGGGSCFMCPNGVTTVMSYVNDSIWDYVGYSPSSGYGIHPFNTSDAKISIDQNNEVYVSCSDNYSALLKKFDGTQWIFVDSFMTNIGTTTNSITPQILFDNNNLINIGFVSSGNDYYGYGLSNPYNTQSNYGKPNLIEYNGWQPPTFTNYNYVGVPEFSTNPMHQLKFVYDNVNNIPYMAFWEENISGSYNPAVMKFDGNSWIYVGSFSGIGSLILTNVNAGGTLIDYGTIDLAIDNNGNPWIAFNEDFPNNTLSVMRFDGTNWVNIGSQNLFPGTPIEISIQISQNNNPYISFREKSPSLPTSGISVMQFNSSLFVNSNTVSINKEDTYFLTAINSYGCSSSDTVKVHFSDLSIDMSQNPVTCSQLNDGSVAVSTSSGIPPYNYQWSTGDTSFQVDQLGLGAYSVTVTDSGCVLSDSIMIQVNVAPADSMHPEICYSSVDYTGFNKVVLKPLENPLTAKYIILREYSAGLYAPLDTIDGSVTEYVDSTSNPSVQAERYKVAAIDACGNVTDTSAYHKTVHLTMNSGINGEVNLSWNQYEGYQVSNYLIYRGDSSGIMIMINSISGTNTSFTDLTPPNGSLTYQVRALAQVCNPLPNAKVIADTLESNIIDHNNTPYSVSITATDPSCFTCNDGFVFANAVGGMSPYTYTWSNGTFGSFNGGLGVGSYMVFVVDAVGALVTVSVTLSASSTGCTDPLALNYDSLATVDDGSCMYVSCPNPRPTGLYSFDVIDTRAKIGWNNMNDSACIVLKYFVRYRELGTSGWTTKSAGVGNGLCNFGLNTITKQLLNLTPSTTYEFRMKAFYCGGTESNYSPPIQFTTADVCPDMTNLTATTFNGNQAKVRFNWDTTGAYTFARILLRVDIPGSNWQTAGGFGVNYPTLFVNKFGLISGQSYRAQGRKFCDPNITAYRSPTWTSPIFWSQPGSIKLEGGTAINNLDVYPNPSMDVFNVSFKSNNQQDLSIRILNVVGGEVYREDRQEFVGEYIKQISLDKYGKGIYFLEIQTNEGIINKKLILQ